MNDLDQRNETSSISCSDLPTLYTKIANNNLLKDFNKLINNFCIKGGNSQYFTGNKHCAKWIDRHKGNSLIFSKSSCNRLLNHT